MQEFMMGESSSESVKNEDLTPGIHDPRDSQSTFIDHPW